MPVKFLIPALALVATPVIAEVPQIVTDIVPVRGLVARVMDGIGEPQVLVPPGASPHGFSLRPSDARALSSADAVFWIGGALTPWLEESIDQLATGASHIALLEAAGTVRLDYRTEATFGSDHDAEHDHDHSDGEDHSHGAKEGHDHDHAHDEGHEHAHDEGHEHDHDHEEGHDHDHDHDHAHAEDHDDHGHHDHDHHGVDPHAWLSPANGQLWLSVIAEELARLDPEHAEQYRANAVAGQAEIEAIVAEVSQTLAGNEGTFLVFHDAYQYFEASFGLTSLGSISLSDASEPSVARIAELRDAVAEAGVSCVFSEPQFKPGLVQSVTESSEVKALVIDPLGMEIPADADFYPTLLSTVGTSFRDCLAK